MRGSLLILIIGMLAPAVPAQSSGHLGVFLEVLPPALRVTVSSSRVDFGQQTANAGHVFLDPTTGEISTKTAGHHQVGQLQLTGRAGAGYAIAVASAPLLRSPSDKVDFGLRWARSRDCQNNGFEALTGPRMVSGIVGQSGCSALQFGGTLLLQGAAEGRYEGHVQVRIAAL